MKSQERVLNLLLKNKKTDSYILLYHSEWDSYSNAIVERAEAWAKEEGDEQCFIISSWELPHVFAAFAISSSPSVVEVRRGKVSVYSEYPKVFEFFSLKSEKKVRRKGQKNRVPKKKIPQ